MRFTRDSESVTRTGARVRQKRLLTLCCGILVVGALLVSIASLAFAATSFPDVPATHPYYAAINDLASRSIIGGYANGSFGPGNAVTRQQFAKMIVLTGGYPVSEANVCSFVDVENSGASSLYPDNYVAVCATNGITTGKTATAFDPGGNITRYQAISMVVRAATNLQPGLLANPPAGWTATGVWGSDPIHGANAARAEYNGLLAGLDLAVISPYANMTRGEVAQVLHNLLGKLPTTTTVAVQYTLLTSVVDGSGTIARSPNQSAFSSGATVTLTANPAAGYYFAGWGGSVTSAQNPLTIAMDSNKAITATFKFRYQDLGEIPANPCITHWHYPTPGGKYFIFWINSSGQLCQRTYNPTTFSVEASSINSANLKPGSTPAAVQWGWGGGPRIDLFARGSNNHLMWRYYTGSWSSWKDLSSDSGGRLWGEILSDPAVCAPSGSGAAPELAVFYRTSNGALGHCTISLHEDGTWAGDSMAEWQDVSSQFKAGSNPAAVSYASGTTDLFTRGSNNHLWHRYCEGNYNWSAWEDLGGALTTSPAVDSGGPRRLEVFAGGPGNTLWQASYGTSGWAVPREVNTGVIASDPDVVALSTRIDVVVRGSDGHLWHTWWDGTFWKPYVPTIGAFPFTGAS